MLDAAARRAAERVAADEREPIRKRRGRLDHGPLCAACVRDDGGSRDVVWQLAENFEVLLNRRGENHEVGVGQHDRIVGGHVDGMEHHRPLEDVLAIDADDERRRPDLPRRERNRSADETQSDDADALKDRRLPRDSSPAAASAAVFPQTQVARCSR